jgi:hypothetical protein
MHFLAKAGLLLQKRPTTIELFFKRGNKRNLLTAALKILFPAFTQIKERRTSAEKVNSLILPNPPNWQELLGVVYVVFIKRELSDKPVCEK